MKKLMAFLATGCLLLWLAGCSAGQLVDPPVSVSNGDVSTRDVPYITETVETVLPMHAIVLPPVKETVTADDGTALVSLSFQQAQVILHNPALEEKIVGALQTRIDPILSTAAEMEDQARQDYPENEFWSEYFIDVSYTPTRLDQAVLSLFGNSFSYSGGPHPSLVTDSVNYDLRTGDVMCLDDILTPECTSDTLYQLVLKSLASQADDLYYDYADALGDRFTGELHSIEDWYFSQSGLCFHFAPYDIAPYSSGTIIAELPYGSLTGIVKDQYFPASTTQATGSMYAETFIEDDSERFTYIAQVPLCEDGTDVLLYPDAAVKDLRIETGYRYEDNNRFVSVSTVFAASTMNVGDAIHLTVDLADEDVVLRLVYRADDQEYSAFITYDELGDSILLTTH